MKRTANQIMSDLKKKKNKTPKKNYSFRLNVELMEKFVEKCAGKDLGTTDVLQELMKDFVEG